AQFDLLAAYRLQKVCRKVTPPDAGSCGRHQLKQGTRAQNVQILAVDVIVNFEFFAAEAFSMPAVFKTRFAAFVEFAKPGEAQPAVAVPGVPSSGGNGRGNGEQERPPRNLFPERGVNQPRHDDERGNQNLEADAVGGFGVGDTAAGFPNSLLNFRKPRGGGHDLMISSITR